MSDNGDLVGGADMLLPLEQKMSDTLEDLKEIYEKGILALTDPTKVNVFKGMSKSLSNLFNKFQSYFEELREMTQEDGVTSVIGEKHTNWRKQAKEYYYESEGMLVELNTVPTPVASSSINNTTVSGRSKTKLPPIKLPSFKGSRTQWPQFRDTFESLIMNDGDLTDMDRFHYLKSSLQDAALAVIAKVPMNEANFLVAWNALKRHYDNKRLLATAYLDKILDMPAISTKPNVDKLTEIISTLSETVAAFNLLEISNPTEFIFFHLSRRCLDKITKEDFENQNSIEFPSFDDLIKFLQSRCTAAELANSGASTSEKKQDSGSSSQRSSGGKTRALYSGSGEGEKGKPKVNDPKARPKIQTPCYICKGSHPIYNCYKFSNTPVSERAGLLQSWKGCRQCLTPQHDTKHCGSRYRCRYCKKRHHSLLHYDAAEEAKEPSNATGLASTSVEVKKPLPQQAVLNNLGSNQVDVMLGTAVCYCKDVKGGLLLVRVAIDSGSHFTFMTSACSRTLGLEVKPVKTNIWGVGETPLKGFKGQALCTLKPTTDLNTDLSTSVIVIDTITSDLPGFATPDSMWDSYLDYNLADPTFWHSRPIDLLIGCDLLHEILTGPIITISPDLPKLVGTVFGFIALGCVREIAEAEYFCSLHTQAEPSNDSLHDELTRFWELEEPVIKKPQNPEDIVCEEFYKKTHFRLGDGRYGVKLPFKTPNPTFGNSKGQAMRRLSHLESRFEKNPVLRDKYNDFIQEYIDLQHMELARNPGLYYIPHHCVLKGEGENAKIRVVFDAAARTCLGSLNESLHVGPKLQADIVLILLNFRRHEFAFITDAEKMYRQLVIHPDDRTYLHILWRFSPDEEVQDYEITTLPYGLSCAPFLALRTIKQLIADHGEEYPLAAEVLETDIFMDDICTCLNSLSSTLELQRQIIGIMAAGGFTLGKWAANHPSLIPPEYRGKAEKATQDPVALDVENNDSVKVLGLQWSPTSDVFSYSISPPPTVCTKRAVLSAVAKIYDPLGLLGPAVLPAKALVQEAWKRKLGWDEKFPEDMQEEWLRFCSELTLLGKIEITRWVAPGNLPCQILIFSDASEKGYCACAYLRTETDSEISVQLLLAKTKLAPLKVTTIPRLELCAALLAARLWETLQPFIKRLNRSVDVCFFSDSSVVLSWLSTPAYKLKTFVANRVVTIREVTMSQPWRHVASEHNPSDLGSRGVNPAQLLNNKLWFEGPAWAKLHPGQWPNSLGDSPVALPELKIFRGRTALHALGNPAVLILWMQRFSNYKRLVNSFSFVIRCLKLLRRQPYEKCVNAIEEEVREGERMLWRLVQAHHFFNDELPTPASKIPKDLSALHPFVSEEGVLRVGGRLGNADVEYETQHQVILPAKSIYTQLLIRFYHKKMLHPGSSLLLAHLRLRFWIVGGKNAVKSMSRTCVECIKVRASPCQPLMGELHSARVQSSGTFTHVGVDYAGPFLVRDSLRRKATSSKAYLCLFICLSTRALHLELVSSLSTPAFLAAMDRFIGRRGTPEIMYSDNGSNFIGAANHLHELYSFLSEESTIENLKTYGNDKQLKWVWTPPSAPSFGGSWERGVRAVKRLLKTVYGENRMTFEELSTLLVKIESIINSRPLCPISEDPKDPGCLTPGHFLIGKPLLALPEPTFVDIKENRLSRWQLINQKSQHFWQRWRLEYLTSLQQRTKWRRPDYNMQIGDLVIIKEDNVPRMKWPTARVQELHAGKDGVVRVVTVQTASTVLRRPVNKLIPLLIGNPDPLFGDSSEGQPDSTET